MAYTTWCVNGYGTRVDNLDVSLEKVEELIAKAPEFEDEIKTYFKESGITKPTLDDYLDYDEDYQGGIAYILKRTISEAENIEFSYAENSNNEWYVLLCPSYPWYKVSGEESRLTEKTVKEMIKKYISILSKQELDIDYQSVENGG